MDRYHKTRFHEESNAHSDSEKEWDIGEFLTTVIKLAI